MSEKYIDAAGIIRWVSNDQVPPADIIAEMGFCRATVANLNAARTEDLRVFLLARSEARANISKEQLAEERFEQRAAFGPGVKLVDIFTGEETIT
tara:strand:+ start:973 stop:1257 length:285 start_codon:yes stop_codon:yes gene_type:complete